MKKIGILLLCIVLTITTMTVGLYASKNEASEEVKISVEKIEKLEEDSTIKVIYPLFSGFNLAPKLNNLIQDKNIKSIGQVRESLIYIQDMKKHQKEMGEQVSNIGVELDTNFDYSLSGNILSVRLNTFVYLGGAHGTYLIDSYNVNTETGEEYTFNALFEAKSNFKKVIMDKLNKLIDSEKHLYFEDAKETLAKMDTNDFQFYFDGNKLVIYFSLYELRPYAGGIPEFKIDVKDLEGLLKNEVYSQTVNAKPIGNYRFNGTAINIPNKPFVKDYYLMVPLRFVAETLGYSVGWDPQKGAIVVGGYIQNNVNSYYTKETKVTPKKLISAPQTIDNRLYVPVEYFSQILNEDVSYDGEYLRIFKYEKKIENQFNNQIVEYKWPTSAEETVESYAKAIKERKGAIQYALFSDKLREANRAKFEEMNWVTGVSSPWVTGYDIKNTGNGTYDITFHWATSTGKAEDSKVKVKVEKVSDLEYWQIIDVKE